MMKRVIAAKIEQIIEFDSAEEADACVKDMKKSDPQFTLIDDDPVDGDKHRIRIAKSYNKNTILVSSYGIENEPEI